MGNSHIIAPSSNSGGVERLPIDWQPIGFIEDRVQRLDSINNVLSSRGLRNLPTLGKWKRGEVELLKIIGIYDHSEKWFTDVQFECKFWTDTIGRFSIRFNAKGDVGDPVVAYARINGKIAVIQQWRPVLGMWTYEIPRGFGSGRTKKFYQETTTSSLDFQDLPFETLLEIIGKEIASFAEIKKVAYLGSPFQNTGTDSASVTNILVDLKVDPGELELRMNAIDRFSPYRLHLFTPSELEDEIGKKINDNHSYVAYFLAGQYYKLHGFT